MKKIALIGSTHLRDKMKWHQHRLREKRDEAMLPSFDNDVEGEGLDLLRNNRWLIEWADEVHLFWDGRSIGTIFDFGMVFALRKPLKIIYMEKKSIKGQMEQYAGLTTGGE